MGKEFIKQLLRENLFSRMKEAQKNSAQPQGEPQGEPERQFDSNKEDFSEKSTKEKKKVQTLTTKIKNATQGPDKILKLSQVGQAAGIINADDASDRSELGKKVSGKPDADGKVRHLTPPEAAKLGKVVDNPTAYIH